MAFIKTNNVIELKNLPVNPEINSELANGIYLLKVNQTMQGLSCELCIKDLNRIETIELEIHLDKQDNEDTFI